MQKIRAGLIGCGRIGFTFDLDPQRTGVWTHAGAYHKHPDIDFIGVYDADDESADKCSRHYRVDKCNNIEELVRECDIVSVAVPENYHDEVLFNILKCKHPPKMLWVEKPFTTSHRTAAQYVEDFQKVGCGIHINYQRRFCEGFIYLRQLGTPKAINVTYVRGLYNTASHFVDMMLGLYGNKCTVAKVTDTDFSMCYDDFVISFSMLKDTKYNICDSTFYYEDLVVRAPPLQTFLEVKSAVPSEQYSEYFDLSEYSKVNMDYEPMLNQVGMMADAIQFGDHSQINNGTDTLKVLGEVCLS